MHPNRIIVRPHEPATRGEGQAKASLGLWHGTPIPTYRRTLSGYDSIGGLLQHNPSATNGECVSVSP